MVVVVVVASVVVVSSSSSAGFGFGFSVFSGFAFVDFGVVSGLIVVFIPSLTSGRPSCAGGSKVSIFFFSKSVSSSSGIFTHLTSSGSITLPFVSPVLSL